MPVTKVEYLRVVSYTEIGRHIINQSNNVIYEDRKNQVYGIG